jgi:transcriptional regulator with XRE-family HTH domain
MNSLDELADHLFERIEKRRIESDKMGRSETGTGNADVGKVLTGYREYRGMTKRSLAKAADLNHTFIGRIENGERGIKIESLCKLRRVLGDEFALEYLDAYDEFVGGYTAGPGPTGLTGESPVQEQPRSPRPGAESHDAPGAGIGFSDNGEDVGTFQVHQVPSGPGVLFSHRE